MSVRGMLRLGNLRDLESTIKGKQRGRLMFLERIRSGEKFGKILGNRKEIRPKKTCSSEDGNLPS